MSIQLGGVIVQYRVPIAIPRPLAERYRDPDYDGDDDPDSAPELLRCLYDGTVRRIEEIAELPALVLADVTEPLVAYHPPCVIVLDRSVAARSNLDDTSGLSALDERLAALSAADHVERVLVFHCDGWSDTHAFCVFEKGARSRRFARIPGGDGEVRIDDGLPLPTEPEGDASPEMRVVSATRAHLEDATIASLTGRSETRAFFCVRA
jgi:hypothetical protein